MVLPARWDPALGQHIAEILACGDMVHQLDDGFGGPLVRRLCVGDDVTAYKSIPGQVFVDAGSIDSKLDSYADRVNAAPLEAAKGM